MRWPLFAIRPVDSAAVIVAIVAIVVVIVAVVGVVGVVGGGEDAGGDSGPTVNVSNGFGRSRPSAVARGVSWSSNDGHSLSIAEIKKKLGEHRQETTVE